MKRSLFCLTLLLLCLATAQAEVTGVVIVRHAEKADDGSDPGLSAAGLARARALSEALENVTIGGLIASQYRRTRQTLAPLAQRTEKEIVEIPATSGGITAHVEAVAAEVRSSNTDGLIVVAGHSNTVPLIVEALSGRVVAPIGESEYDRLFLLLPAESGMSVVAARYGVGWNGGDSTEP